MLIRESEALREAGKQQFGVWSLVLDATRPAAQSLLEGLTARGSYQPLLGLKLPLPSTLLFVEAERLQDQAQ